MYTQTQMNNSKNHQQSRMSELGGSTSIQYRTINNFNLNYNNSRIPSVIEQRNQQSENLMQTSKNGKESVMSRAMLYMKEQIEISCRFYVQKMNSQLKDQAKQIMKLRSLLQKNYELLKQKQNMIQNLNKEKSPLKKKFIVLSKQMREMDYSTRQKTSSDLTNKIKQIQDQVSFLNEYQRQTNSRITNSINVKLQCIEKEIIKSVGGKLNVCKAKVQQYLSIKTTLINSINEKINVLFTHLQKINNQQPLTKKLKYLENQVQELKQLTNTFLSKEFKYQNYQIQRLELSIKSMNLKINQLQRNRTVLSINSHPSSLSLEDNKPNCYNSQRLISQIDNLKRTQLSKIESSKTTQITSNESKGNPIKEINYNSGLQKQQEQEEYDNYQDIDSAEEMSEDSGDQFFYPKENPNQERLIALIEQMCIRLPIKVQIDQTGYLKLTETGMYLVDGRGDGFQLQQDELVSLVKMGILKLTHDFQF